MRYLYYSTSPKAQEYVLGEGAKIFSETDVLNGFKEAVFSRHETMEDQQTLNPDDVLD